MEKEREREGFRNGGGEEGRVLVAMEAVKREKVGRGVVLIRTKSTIRT